MVLYAKFKLSRTERQTIINELKTSHRNTGTIWQCITASLILFLNKNSNTYTDNPALVSKQKQTLTVTFVYYFQF